MINDKLFDGLGIATLYSCPHGLDYCSYKDHDDEFCQICLKDTISFYKKKLKELKNGKCS